MNADKTKVNEFPDQSAFICGSILSSLCFSCPLRAPPCLRGELPPSPFPMKLFHSLLAILTLVTAASAAEPEFQKDVLPILNKYCNGCHNADDREGKLDLSSHAAML